MKQLIAFDLDGTLAQSKQAIDEEMAGILSRLTRTTTVAVISGGDWPQFEQQLIGKLPADADVSRMLMLPASGTKFYRHENGAWTKVYADIFTGEERQKIITALDDAVEKTGLSGDKSWGEKIEDRGSQITFSGLGQEAPLQAKHDWDPDFRKRKKLQEVLTPVLKGFSVRVGGSTSIDITREGVDKAFAMGRVSELSGIATEDMIFLGDAVYPGGNDYPVREAGIDTVAVGTVEETKRAIEGIIFCIAAQR
jgi:HAD superfamily hydrolase (TIGR01484 family)